MKGLCLGFHDWKGCVCGRCGQSRNTDHTWTGCVCSDCGQHRDAGHDWETLADCGRKCHRCGQRASAVHDLDGCVCRVCGGSFHLWKAGTCERCGCICDHPETTNQIEGDLGEETIYAAVVKVCAICGKKLEQVWKK